VVDLTADGADVTDRKEPERVAASMALSRPSDFARPAQRLPHPRNPRNPRSLLCSVTRRAFSSALRAAPQPSGFAVGCAGPQTTQTDAELGGASARTGSVRSEGGALYELSFVAVESRSIGTDGLRKLWDATTPNPLRKRRGLDVMGTGDRGWRPGGLTPGYCLKPFQGFEDGLGMGRGSAELMTSSEVIEGLDGGWDVSSQKVLGCEGAGGLETGRLQPRSN